MFKKASLLAVLFSAGLVTTAFAAEPAPVPPKAPQGHEQVVKHDGKAVHKDGVQKGEKAHKAHKPDAAKKAPAKGEKPVKPEGKKPAPDGKAPVPPAK